MKAVVYHGPGDIRVEETPPPECGPGELLLEVDACAVCGTDLKSYRHGNPRIRAPLVIGHEFTGRVCRAGPGAAGFREGQRVVMATSVSCGACYYCQRGWKNLCVDLAPMGFACPGGMARYVAIPARALAGGHVVAVPETVAAEHAALAEPLSCAIHCAEQCGLGRGDTVVVLGAGPMGLMNVCIARALGASTIILAEISPPRLALAGSFGCDLLVNPAEKDLAGRVMRATGGLGADVVVVAAPAAGPQQMALELVRKRGTVCLFASLPAGRSTLALESRRIHYGELRVLGSSDSTPEDVRRAVELLAAGAVPAGKLVTHVLALDEVFRAFELMEGGAALRVVLKP